MFRQSIHHCPSQPTEPDSHLPINLSRFLSFSDMSQQPNKQQQLGSHISSSSSSSSSAVQRSPYPTSQLSFLYSSLDFSLPNSSSPSPLLDFRLPIQTSAGYSSDQFCVSDFISYLPTNFDSLNNTVIMNGNNGNGSENSNGALRNEGGAGGSGVRGAVSGESVDRFLNAGLGNQSIPSIIPIGNEGMSMSREDLLSSLERAQGTATLVSHLMLVHSAEASNGRITFNYRLNDSPGFDTNRHFNIKQALKTKTNRPLEQFSLGRGAVQSDYFVVGTDHESSPDNYLIYLNGSTMMENIRAEPIVSYVRVNQQVRDVRWLGPGYLLVATGPGRMHIYNVNEQKEFVSIANVNHVHSQEIREMSVKPGSNHLVATGGLDKLLCLLDVSGNSLSPVLDSVLLGSEVGSVKWADSVDSNSVSITTDNGSFYLFDTRQALNASAPAWSLHTKKEEMYAHDRYDAAHVLLGFSDGEIRQLDMRQNGQQSMISAVTDPYVQGIGIIEYNTSSRSFVTSGYTDFTVWKHENSGDARAWSHSKSGQLKINNQNHFSCCSTYFDADTVLTTDSYGFCGLYIQKF